MNCCNALFQTGGAKGARTPDLNTASVALSQLSYGPRTAILNNFSPF